MITKMVQHDLIVQSMVLRNGARMVLMMTVTLAKTSGMKFVGTDWCGENDIRVSVWDKKGNMDFCWITY